MASAQTENPRLRIEYFEAQRAYPFVEIPAGALRRARLELERLFGGLTVPAGAAAAANGVPFWTELGPGTIGGQDAGRLTAIAIDPRDPSTLYVGGAQGGVWKTLDGGASWTPLTDGECSLAMGALALDPVNPDIVYAGTGELHFSQDSYYGCGVLRSLDGGATWQQMGASEFDTSTGGARVSKLIVDPTTAGSAVSTVLYASTSFGVYRSPDSGTTWTRVLTGIATDLVAHPADPARFYAAIGSASSSANNGVFRTTNGGASWTQLGGGLPVTDVGRIVLAITPSQPLTLYAAVQNGFNGAQGDGTLLGVWKSANGGDTWFQLPPTNLSCNQQCWYDLVVAVHPTIPDLVFFGGVPLYRSTNGGQTFANVSSTIHVDQHTMAFDPLDPNTVYVGNDGGIYRSRDQGLSWMSLNTNLGITQFYSGVALHPDRANNVLGGTQDNGTLEFGGFPSWNRVVGADGGFAAIDHVSGFSAYAETQWQANSGFAGPRRRDGSGPFIRKVQGIDTSDRGLFIPPLVMDPASSSVLYFGTFRLYRTLNRGEQWSTISPDLTGGSGAISAIAPAPSDPATIWVGTSNGGVRVTTDDGATWPSRSAGLPDRYVSDIAVHPEDARRAVLTVSGFNAHHVFLTSNGGESWQSINGNLPDVPVNAVLYSTYLGDRIVIGTDLGVYTSVDGGATWSLYGAGMPNVAVFDLVYNPFTGRIVAATHGRGTFALTPLTASSVVAAQDSVGFASLGDTTRLAASAFDGDGAPFQDVVAHWRSLNPAVATVRPGGLVRAAGAGVANIIASAGGKSDTTRVGVVQIAVAIGGLADSTRAVQGERAPLGAAALDAGGSTIVGQVLQWTTTDPAVVTVEPDGTFTAHAIGAATVTAALGALRDSTRFVVEAPSTTTVTAAPLPAATVQSAAGVRFPLLRLSLRVVGLETVEVQRLVFEVMGRDPNVRVSLVSDTDHDGQPDENETTVASITTELVENVTTRVTLQPPQLRVTATDSVVLLASLRLSEAPPHGTVFHVRFLPEETRTLNLRSGAANRLVLPQNPVMSAPVLTTVLAQDAPFSLSENPVRTRRVTINFAEPPRGAAIYTVSGRRVADLLQRGTPLRVVWDLTNDEGARVAPGVYLVVVELSTGIITEKLIVIPFDEPPSDGRTPPLYPLRSEPRARPYGR